MLSPRWMIASAMLVWSAVASAQVTECVDANGKKTYMETCPDGTVKQRDIEALTPAKPKASAPDQALQNQEDAFAQRRDERLKAAADAADKERKANDAKQTCAGDKLQLEALQSGRNSRRVDPTTGEHIAVDEDQRQTEIGQLNTQIQALGDACQ